MHGAGPDRVRPTGDLTDDLALHAGLQLHAVGGTYVDVDARTRVHTPSGDGLHAWLGRGLSGDGGLDAHAGHGRAGGLLPVEPLGAVAVGDPRRAHDGDGARVHHGRSPLLSRYASTAAVHVSVAPLVAPPNRVA